MLAKKQWILGMAICLFCAASLAETTPQGNGLDGRMKIVDYDAQNVVRVVGQYGYVTDIVFASGEHVIDRGIAVGDQLAWKIATVENHLFVKPTELNAEQNMIVVTNKRTYTFSLYVGGQQNKDGKSENPYRGYFSIVFHYPDDEAAVRRQVVAEKEKQAEVDRVKILMNRMPEPTNWNYWSCGPWQIRPTEVYDDGRFTYFRFPFAQEVPAVFMVNTDGAESIINGYMRNDQWVVEGTAAKFVLRKGKSVGCIENRSYYPWGVPTKNGTPNPYLERRVKTNAPVVEDLPPGANTEATAHTNAVMGGAVPKPVAPLTMPQISPMSGLVMPVQPQLQTQPVVLPPVEQH